MRKVTRSKKRWVAAAMAALLACSVFTGCSKGGNGGDDKVSKDGVVQLTLSSSYGNYGSQYLKELVKKFNNSQDEYFLTVPQGGSVETIHTKLLVSDPENYPSIICGKPTTIASYAEADYVAPLQQFIDADSEDITATMYPAVVASYSDKEGNIIGHPMGVSCNGYMVNEDILAKLGYTLDDLTSFEKIANIATQAVKKGYCQYGISFSSSGTDFLDMMCMQGADCVDAGNGYTGDATKSVVLEGESYTALKKATDIYAKLYKDKVALEYGYGSDCATIFRSNQILFWKCTNSSVHNMVDNSGGVKWAFIPSVGIDENAKFKGGVLSEGTGLFICNTGNEKEMQGAYEFVKFVNEAENQVYFEQNIGYIPYTTEAEVLYREWSDVNFTSASRMLKMFADTSSDLRLPYVPISMELISAFGDLMSYVSADPSGDLDSYIQSTSDRINDGIKIYAQREGDK